LRRAPTGRFWARAGAPTAAFLTSCGREDFHENAPRRSRTLQGQGDVAGLRRLDGKLAASAMRRAISSRGQGAVWTCGYRPGKDPLHRLNYRAHAAETGNPVPKTPILFTSSIPRSYPGRRRGVKEESQRIRLRGRTRDRDRRTARNVSEAVLRTTSSAMRRQ